MGKKDKKKSKFDEAKEKVAKGILKQVAVLTRASEKAEAKRKKKNKSSVKEKSEVKSETKKDADSEDTDYLNTGAGTDYLFHGVKKDDSEIEKARKIAGNIQSREQELKATQSSSSSSSSDSSDSDSSSDSDDPKEAEKKPPCVPPATADSADDSSASAKSAKTKTKKRARKDRVKSKETISPSPESREASRSKSKSALHLSAGSPLGSVASRKRGWKSPSNQRNVHERSVSQDESERSRSKNSLSPQQSKSKSPRRSKSPIRSSRRSVSPRRRARRSRSPRTRSPMRSRSPRGSTSRRGSGISTTTIHRDDRALNRNIGAPRASVNKWTIDFRENPMAISNKLESCKEHLMRRIIFDWRDLATPGARPCAWYNSRQGCSSTESVHSANVNASTDNYNKRWTKEFFYSHVCSFCYARTNVMVCHSIVSCPYVHARN